MTDVEDHAMMSGRGIQLRREQSRTVSVRVRDDDVANRSRSE